VDGVRFSLTVPMTEGEYRRWENGPHERIGDQPPSQLRTHGLLISKSTLRGQAAEVVIFWAGFQGGGRPHRAPSSYPRVPINPEPILRQPWRVRREQSSPGGLGL